MSHVDNVGAAAAAADSDVLREFRFRQMVGAPYGPEGASRPHPRDLREQAWVLRPNIDAGFRAALTRALPEAFRALEEWRSRSRLPRELSRGTSTRTPFEVAASSRQRQHVLRALLSTEFRAQLEEAYGAHLEAEADLGGTVADLDDYLEHRTEEALKLLPSAAGAEVAARLADELQAQPLQALIDVRTCGIGALDLLEGEVARRCDGGVASSLAGDPAYEWLRGVLTEEQLAGAFARSTAAFERLGQTASDLVRDLPRIATSRDGTALAAELEHTLRRGSLQFPGTHDPDAVIDASDLPLDLSHRVLPQIDLAGARLWPCTSFAGSSLDFADFHDMKTTALRMTAAGLSGLIATNAVLPRSNFDDADLRSATFDGADLRKCSFRGANLEGASFLGADLTGVDLRGARLCGAQFDPEAIATLSLSDEQRAQLPGAGNVVERVTGERRSSRAVRRVEAGEQGGAQPSTARDLAARALPPVKPDSASMKDPKQAPGRRNAVNRPGGFGWQ